MILVHYIGAAYVDVDYYSICLTQTFINKHCYTYKDHGDPACIFCIWLCSKPVGLSSKELTLRSRHRFLMLFLWFLIRLIETQRSLPY